VSNDAGCTRRRECSRADPVKETASAIEVIEQISEVSAHQRSAPSGQDLGFDDAAYDELG